MNDSNNLVCIFYSFQNPSKYKNIFNLVLIASNMKELDYFCKKNLISSVLVHMFNTKGIIVNGEYCNSQF